MQRTKEGDLVTAIAIYAVRCLAEGDHASLRKMKFGKKEIDELSKMDLMDLSHIATLRSHCLEIGLNREIYWEMMRFLRTQRDAEDFKDKLVTLDAPYDLLKRFYGMSTREYTDRRRAFGDDSVTSAGRPEEPTDDESHRLWRLWKKLAGDQETRLLTPEQYLELSADAEMSIRSVWLLCERWRRQAKDELTRIRTTMQPRRANPKS